jgi:hypothetical protein
MGNEDFSTSVPAIGSIVLEIYNCAVFEAVHGSAPDIAGKNLPNPTALRDVGGKAGTSQFADKLIAEMQSPQS